MDIERFKSLIMRAYDLLAKVGNGVGILLLLLIRLNWGWQFFVSGKGKLLNHQSIVDFFTELHIPFPDINAWFVGGLECVGGILLILGLATRPIGFLLSANMVVAYLSVEDDRNSIFNFFKDQTPFLQADPFFFLLTALLAFGFGGGPLSVDALIARAVKKNTQKAASTEGP